MKSEDTNVIFDQREYEWLPHFVYNTSCPLYVLCISPNAFFVLCLISCIAMQLTVMTHLDFVFAILFINIGIVVVCFYFSCLVFQSTCVSLKCLLCLNPFLALEYTQSKTRMLNLLWLYISTPIPKGCFLFGYTWVRWEEKLVIEPSHPWSIGSKAWINFLHLCALQFEAAAFQNTRYRASFSLL